MNQEKPWRRPHWVAIVTGVIAVGLSLAYLVLVELLDFRGAFLPAPLEGCLKGSWGILISSLCSMR